MRVIPTNIHGIVDYIVGLLLVAAPWLLGFDNDGPQTWVPVAAGLLTIGASMFTDYEWGLVRSIPIPAHLGLDILLGAILAASPWIFGFADAVWIPHVAVGLGEILIAALSQPHAETAAAGRMAPTH